MNKNKSMIFGVLILLITIGLNLSHILNNYGVKDNKLHVEVLAMSSSTYDGKDGGYNNFFDWFAYGLTKDEYSKVVECESTKGFVIGIPGIVMYDSREKIIGRKIACFDGGYTNCDATACGSW